MSGSGSSGSGIVLTGLVLAGFATLAIWLRRREMLAVRDGFRLCGSNDATLSGTDAVAGTIEGRSVRYQVIQGGKHSPGRTVVETPAPAGMPLLEMHLSPQGAGNRRLVERGLEIDVVVGDALFDEQIVVEAAPAVVARAVLDAHTRSHVLAAMPCTIDVADGVVRISRRGKVTRPDLVSNLLATLSRLAQRLGSAGGDLAQQRLEAMAHGASGYRGPSPSDANIGLEGALPGGELAQLRAVRARRIRRGRTLTWALIGGIFVAWLTVAMVTKRGTKASATRAVPQLPSTAALPFTPLPPLSPFSPLATSRPGTFRDTEGRSFYERSGSGTVAFVDPATVDVVPLAGDNPAFGTPAFGLWFESHFVRVCDGYRDAKGVRAVYESCRPVVCAMDADCPKPRATSPPVEPTVECMRGWCGMRSTPLGVNDVVAACLAGTGPDWRSPEQKTLVQKARACRTSPCEPPAECRVP